MVHEAVLLIIRRSWVRAPPATSWSATRGARSPAGWASDSWFPA